MTTIGFDVAKDSIVGVRIDRSTNVKGNFVLANNPEAINDLVKELSLKNYHLNVACEATAEYHLLLAKACVNYGIPFRLINPILTKQFTRATVRKKKTDLTDAHIIAKLALQGEGTPIGKEHFSPLKPISRTALKLAKAHQMINLIAQRYDNHLSKEKKLREQLGRCLEILEESIKVFRKKANKLTNPRTLSLLQSIIGIGPTVAGSIIAEIGDIKRFKSGKALVAYIGLDPRVKQSGASLKHNTRITKRGSSYLRRNIFVAASIAQRHDPELKDYYLKKRNEGKRYKEATIAVARKLVYRVYAVWRRETPYVKRCPQIKVLT